MPVIYELHMQHVLDFLNLSDKRVNRNNNFTRDDGKYKDDDYGLIKEEESKEENSDSNNNKNRYIDEIRVENSPKTRKDKFIEELEVRMKGKSLSTSTNMQSSFGFGISLNS